jgi:hypothetical protein
MIWRRLRPGEFDLERVVGLMVIPVLAAGGYLAVFLLPRVWRQSCRFLALTDLPCFTCGSSRAFHLLLTGQPLEAFLAQPLVVTVGACAFVYALYSLVVVLGDFPRIRLGQRIPLRLLLLGAGLLVLANWVYLIWRV